jgi:hypothetical protein
LGGADIYKRKSAKNPFEQLPSTVADFSAKIKTGEKLKLEDYNGIEKKLEYAEGHKNLRFYNWSLLNKFQLALHLANTSQLAKLFDTEEHIWKEVNLLIQL